MHSSRDLRRRSPGRAPAKSEFMVSPVMASPALAVMAAKHAAGPAAGGSGDQLRRDGRAGHAEPYVGIRCPPHGKLARRHHVTGSHASAGAWLLARESWTFRRERTGLR